jgi:hypothetical protein
MNNHSYVLFKRLELGVIFYNNKYVKKHLDLIHIARKLSYCWGEGQWIKKLKD